ncbi:helix-turn-helix transcriptional regulator [Streptomyces actinomycinicus]|uniref:Helix-turn-helix transcriptional regulator n=1 Tax=Streptomyces actinomycinicus TaxID=1695166 RepID=A0A937ERA2_9ACTN|nr:helix-turn-helix transcriptional regulator [Streptomyces actinomycinicus]MBL1086549.1 helix-turn-helix transcriptional regulator [Streptomyces actinomycinicus]
MLEPLGLEEQTEAVYLAVLRHPGSDVHALAEHVGASEESVARALDALADLALIRRSWSDSRTAVPVSPQAGLEALLARQRLELAERQRQVEAVQLAAAELIADYPPLTGTGPGQELERLEGVAVVRQTLEQLAATAQEETLALAPGGPQLPDNRAASRPLARSILARSVRMKTVYLDSVRNDPESLEHARWLVRNGAETRTTPVLPLRLQVVDRAIALVPIDPQDTSRGALLVREAGLVHALVSLFDLIWDSAVPFGEPAPRSEDSFTRQELELLHLLNQGLTDEAAARKLGVSLRTERRMITNIADRLGAKSRFQLGQRSYARGLLS